MLTFPNGEKYNGDELPNQSTNHFSINIKGLTYSGHFENGVFSGTIGSPYHDDLYGTVVVYKDGKRVDSYGIDEDGLIV